jgi:hypothetical protein
MTSSGVNERVCLLGAVPSGSTIVVDGTFTAIAPTHAMSLANVTSQTADSDLTNNSNAESWISGCASRTIWDAAGGRCVPDAPMVRLRPYGHQSAGTAYGIEVIDWQMMPLAAPSTIDVTLRRRVTSGCRGLLFDSVRTVSVPTGNNMATYNYDASRDPQCRDVGILTHYLVTQAVMTSTVTGGTAPLDLSRVPVNELELYIVR